MSPPTRPVGSRLIGEALFDDVLHGLLRQDHFALIGPPRAGKSDIVSEVMRRIAARGGPNRPAIVQVSPPVADGLGSDSLIRRFADRLGVGLPDGPISSARLSEVLLHLISARLEQVPGRVIFAIHDIHALPLHQAREVLSTFAQCWYDERLRNRVAVIVTGTGDFTAMVQSANSPYRFATRISIEGMDQDFSKQFFQDLVGQAVPDDAFATLYEETCGSPLLIEDIAAASTRSAVRGRRSSGHWDSERIRGAVHVYLDDFMDENIVLRTMLRDIENREREFAMFLDILRLGDGQVFLDPTEEELERESDLFSSLVDGGVPAGMQHPPIPFLVVSGAVVRDASHRAYLSSPLLRRFCERRYTPAHVGDVYSGLRKWELAWSEYQKWHGGDVLRPIFGVSRFRVEDVLVDWGNSFHEAAVNGIETLLDRFLNGARYLLHFKEAGIWNLSDGVHLDFPPRGEAGFRDEILALPEYQRLDDCADPKRPEVRRSEDCSTVLAVIRCDGEVTSKLLLGLKRQDPDGEVDTRTFRIVRRALTTFASALTACLKDQYADTLGRASRAHQVALHRAHELLSQDPVSINDVLDGVCQSLVDQGYYRVLVCLVDPTGQRIDGTNEKSKAEAVSLGANTHYLLAEPEKDVQPYVVVSKRYYIIAEGTTDPRANRDLCRIAGVAGACIVPMRVGNQVLGTVHFERGDKAPPHVGEAELFQVFADELALIVREGQRMSMLTTALDGVEDPIAFTDVLGNAIYLNRRASEIVDRNPGWQSARASLAPQFDPGLPHGDFAGRFDLVKEQKGRVTRYWAPLTQKWASAVAWQGHTIYRHNGAAGALVERFQDLSLSNDLIDVINRAAAVSDTRERARVYLSHLRARGYGKPRLYLADECSGRKVLKSFAAVDFGDRQRLRRFEDGGVVKTSDSKDAWIAIDRRETLILDVDPGIDALGLPREIVESVPEEEPLRGERSTPWIDIPLWEADALVGKISVNYPATFTPERWQYLKLFAGKIAAGDPARVDLPPAAAP
ncbi:MAG: GAF domain-containing protein [Polyangiaceae bacterium]|nr:GAF domain-containing protein [Polyangiaceae bacterium]